MLYQEQGARSVIAARRAAHSSLVAAAFSRNSSPARTDRRSVRTSVCPSAVCGSAPRAPPVGGARCRRSGSPPAHAPHAPTLVGGQPYTYDANGNLLSGGGRTYLWNSDNQPRQITHQGVTESYSYDADGNRALRHRAGVTTTYFAGHYEQVGGTLKRLYPFNGRVIAQREGASSLTYLHADHLGGTLLTTNSAGGFGQGVMYTPWGDQRLGGFSTTTLNFTGQRRDDTGLLYYHARYYDPVLGRFISPDTVVPGDALGGMDGVALKPLTVDFHEPGFVATLNQENQLPFWFEMGDEQQRQVGRAWGPANPQSLNRYAYVLNNPLRWTDPTGHWTISINIGGELFAGAGGRGQYSIVIDGVFD